MYGMLDTCKKKYDVKGRMDGETLKLMKRMDLDRPILQREKYGLIFLENFDGAADKMQTDKDAEPPTPMSPQQKFAAAKRQPPTIIVAEAAGKAIVKDESPKGHKQPRLKKKQEMQVD